MENPTNVQLPVVLLPDLNGSRWDVSSLVQDPGSRTTRTIFSEVGSADFGVFDPVLKRHFLKLGCQKDTRTTRDRRGGHLFFVLLVFLVSKITTG